MKDIKENIDNSDIEIEYLKDHNLLEVRLCGDLRKSIRTNRNRLDEILPEDFIIRGFHREEFKVDKSLFNVATGWRARFEIKHFDSSELSSDIEQYSITVIVPPIVMGYVYWDGKVGNILSVGPTIREELEGEPMLEIPMDRLVKLLGGDQDIKDYYITFAQKDLKSPVIKKRPTIGTAPHAIEPYQFLFNPLNKILEVTFNTNLTEPLTFYITKAGDPTYIIEKLSFDTSEVDKQLIPINTTLREISIYIQSVDGIFTPVAYALAQEKSFYEIPRNYPNPEILIHLEGNQLVITLKEVHDVENFIGDEERSIIYHGQKGFTLYVTRRGDPFYLIREIYIPFGKLMMKRKWSVTEEIDIGKDEEISIYTNPIFETYSLTVG